MTKLKKKISRKENIKPERKLEWIDSERLRKI